MTIIKTRALLFDMDGTLVDSHFAVQSAWKAFGERYDIDFETIKREGMGKPASETVAHFLGSGKDAEEGLRLVDDLELVTVDGIVPIADADRIVGSLAPSQWALCTSAAEDLARVRLGAAKLPWPQTWVTYDQISRGKPDPDTFLTGAKRLGVPIEDCIVFEDSEAGLRAGKASGATTVRVGFTEAVYSVHDLPHIHDWTDVTITPDPNDPDWLLVDLGDHSMS